MKKKLCMLLGLTLLTGTLAGCGNTSESTEGSAKAETAASQQTAAEEKKDESPEEAGKEQITVKLGMCPFEEESQEIWDKYNKDVETFKEMRPDVIIENARYDYSPDTFVPLAESGNLPTAFGTWFTEPQKLINNGYVADITEVLEERGWLELMNSSVLQSVSDKEGRVYGIPANGYALGLLMNVDLFTQAGLVDESGMPIQPKTWEEVAESAQKIKEATGTPGFCLLGQDNGAGWHFTNIAWGFGAQFCIDNGDGTYTANVDSPEAIEAMQFVKDMKWKYDILTEDPLTENGGTGLAHLASGTAAMYIGSNEVNGLIDNGAALGDFALGAVPAGPKGQYSLFGGTMYMFSKDATKEEIHAALDFLELYEGIGPDVSEEALDSIAKRDAQMGRPIMPAFQVWNNPEAQAIRDKVVENNQNLDKALYQSYFETVAQEGNLHMEEAAATQDLYAELTKVIQAVVTDKDADVAELMKTADQNYQVLLDSLNK